MVQATSERHLHETSPTATLPESIDIAIVGAGPQALTLATHLIQKKKLMRERFVVIDPAGTWMQQWQHQFAAMEIPHLRSPAVHHPDPNPHALRAFAAGKTAELFPPYDLPGTSLFQGFCQHTIQRWGLTEKVVAARVKQINPYRHTSREYRFRLVMANGRSLSARRVVLAMGGGSPLLPEWVGNITSTYPADRLCHAQDVDLRRLKLAGETILIVGSGLTSGHLALGAIARGATVMMMARRQFYEKLFDTDPGWLGPKYLSQFHAEPNWERRWQMMRAARNGGSLTPAILTRLRRASRQDKLTFYERCQIKQAEWEGTAWQVQCEHSNVHVCVAHQSIDRIWLATGSQLNAEQWDLLSEFRSVFPCPMVNGMPILDEFLRWPGSNLFIMGGAAALRIGPVARNLFGARLASRCIVPALLRNPGVRHAPN
ncbi:MAG: FAD/NAD(P)-binding protein [Cyanobacteria bacterium P01_D01_bin.123]